MGLRGRKSQLGGSGETHQEKSRGCSSLMRKEQRSKCTLLFMALPQTVKFLVKHQATKSGWIWEGLWACHFMAVCPGLGRYCLLKLVTLPNMHKIYLAMRLTLHKTIRCFTGIKLLGAGAEMMARGTGWWGHKTATVGSKSSFKLISLPCASIMLCSEQCLCGIHCLLFIQYLEGICLLRSFQIKHLMVIQWWCVSMLNRKSYVKVEKKSLKLLVKWYKSDSVFCKD